MQKNNFRIFSWKLPFLPALKNYIAAITDNNPLSALVIIPHNRPWRYFLDLYAKEGKPGGLPKMLSFPELVGKWDTSPRPRQPVSTLDQIFLLHESIKSLTPRNEKLSAKFASMEIEEFFPWGLRLATLLDEIFTESLTPGNIENLEFEVGEPAAAILASLRQIADKWQTVLDDKNLTTPGYSALLAAKNRDRIPSLFMPGKNRPVIIAGFYSLNGTQEILFRALHEKGAQICLHTDPAIASGGEPHWACSEHVKWINSWKAGTDLIEQQEMAPKTVYSFFSAYDSHSQLQEMAKKLTETPESNDSTAIVLPNPSQLMPILHHLPEKGVNISIGYPLERSTFNGFLQELFELQNSRNPEGKYYWRNLLKVINHPFMSLSADEDSEENQELRNALRQLAAKIIKNQKKFVEIDPLFADISHILEDALKKRFNDCKLHFIDNMANLDTTAKVAQALDGLCMFLAENGGGKWHSFPMDREAISRLYYNILPQFRNSFLKDMQFSPRLLQGLLAEMISQERTPLEADPIVGLQVMGLLETRLLQFDRVMILDATDDNLPGNPPQNPLLPDSLRPALGLPDSRARERNMAHYLARLCQGAKQAHFLWQEGVSHTGIFDGKKTRSRFVERLIWEEEQKRGKLLKTGEEPLYSAKALIFPQKPLQQTIRVTPAIKAQVRNFLDSRISPTRLDAYLSCPFSFAQRYLLRINEADEICEGEDRAAIGECIHNTLYNFYRNYLNKPIPADGAKRLAEEFQLVFMAQNLAETLPADSSILLQVSAPEKLRVYFENQPGNTTVLEVEKSLEATVNLFNDTLTFQGRIDRLDKRDGKLLLLDYKTGKLKKYDPALWTDTQFFHDLEKLCTDDQLMAEKGDEYLLKLRERLPSIQLPSYIMLLKELKIGEIGNAAFVELYDKGEEVNLFDEAALKNMDQTVRNCEIAVAFIVNHMKKAKEFSAEEGEACKYCQYSQLCLS